jgi:hypothetical protein
MDAAAPPAADCPQDPPLGSPLIVIARPVSCAGRLWTWSESLSIGPERSVPGPLTLPIHVTDNMSIHKRHTGRRKTLAEGSQLHTPATDAWKMIFGNFLQLVLCHPVQLVRSRQLLALRPGATSQRATDRTNPRSPRFCGGNIARVSSSRPQSE